MMHTSMPRAFRRPIAAAASLLSVSASANAPTGLPSADTATMLAMRHTSSETAGRATPAKSGLPAFTKPAPAIWALMPAPTAVCAFSEAGICTPRACAAATMAAASGWAAFCSTAAARRYKSSSLKPLSGASHTAATCGLPSVSVPVLSSTTVSMCAAASIEAASLNQMPCFTALPMPTIIAAGVARPRAHGQAITSTATACMSAVVQSPLNHQVSAKVISATATTAGTNTAAALSATRAIGALLPCASESAFIMSPSRVSLPSCAARYTMLPSVISAPAKTLLPACLISGFDSPVRWLSSAQPLPRSTIPSAAMRSPWLARMRSPTMIWSAGRLCHWPPRSTVTCLGVSFSSRPRLLRLDFLVRCSKNLPSDTKPTTITPASK